MAGAFIFRPHVNDLDVISTPDLLIDQVYIADQSTDTLKVTRITNDRLTTNPEIQVLGSNTTGDAAVLLVGSDAGLLVGLGSNHRHRDQGNPQLFSKPISRQIWRYEPISGVWPTIIIKLSNSKGDVLQDGALKNILAIDKVVSTITPERTDLGKGIAVLCIGLPLPDSNLLTDSYNLELEIPGGEQKLSLNYRAINILP